MQTQKATTPSIESMQIRDQTLLLAQCTVVVPIWSSFWTHKTQFGHGDVLRECQH
jgi:hypothetical protein